MSDNNEKNATDVECQAAAQPEQPEQPKELEPTLVINDDIMLPSCTVGTRECRAKTPPKKVQAQPHNAISSSDEDESNGNASSGSSAPLIIPPHNPSDSREASPMDSMEEPGTWILWFRQRYYYVMRAFDVFFAMDSTIQAEARNGLIVTNTRQLARAVLYYRDGAPLPPYFMKFLGMLRQLLQQARYPEEYVPTVDMLPEINPSWSYMDLARAIMTNRQKYAPMIALCRGGNTLFHIGINPDTGRVFDVSPQHVVTLLLQFYPEEPSAPWLSAYEEEAPMTATPVRRSREESEELMESDTTSEAADEEEQEEPESDDEEEEEKSTKAPVRRR